MAHDEKLDKGRIQLASFISFLMGFSQAVILYVVSSYFKQATGTENVGIIYAFAYAIALVLLLNLHKLVRWLGKSVVFYLAVLIKIIALVFLVSLEPSRLGILLLMVYVIAMVVEWTSLDVIIESFSVDRMSGRIRGFHLMILNAGFIFGPFVSTYLLGKIGFQGVFVFALIFNAFVLIFSLIGFRKVNHRFEQRLKVSDLIKKVACRKNVMRIYYISFALEFFYALMIIYTPIYLRDLGYSWEQIGLIFTAMLVPFLVLQYPAGILADKKIGEKETIIAALAIMIISTLFIYFLGTASALEWAIALFATRIGAALVDILRDSYFYKKIDGHDVDVINFFRTAMPTAYITSSILSSFLLFFLPIKVAFILISLVISSALYPAFKLVDNKCEKEFEEAKC